MTLVIENKDLFDVSREYHLAHCISADFALGAGIAQIFDVIYGMREKLNKQWPNFIDMFDDDKVTGYALLVNDTFNLVTKAHYWDKPTYSTLECALIDMRNQMNDLGVKKLAIPMLGCGKDKLKWELVQEIIEDVFEDTDVEILVCEL